MQTAISGLPAESLVWASQRQLVVQEPIGDPNYEPELRAPHTDTQRARAFMERTKRT